MNNEDDDDDGDDEKIKAPEIMRKSCAKVDTSRRDRKYRRKQIPKVGYIDTKFFFFFFVLLFAVDAGFFVSIFF